MIYTIYDILWLFFTYSFAGWVLQTTISAIKNKKFVNKGVVNLPFNVLSGITAIFITIFFGELQGVWLFLGSAIVAGLFQWVSGHLIEKIYQIKCWDYSREQWNLDGYIFLQASVAWGVFSIIMMRWGNNLILKLFHMIPGTLDVIIVLVLLVLLALDILATLIVMSAQNRDTQRWEAVDRWFTRYTLRLADKIYARVNHRIEKAYPEAKKIEKTKEKSDVFAYGCCFDKLVWLFVIGSFLGDITETIFCRFKAGVWMSRSSLVWGPFSIVWGFAIVAATVLLYKYIDKSETVLFLVGTFLGGAYEYVCSVLSELVFGKVFWDYSAMPFNLGGRINLLYCFFWGIAAVLWIKVLYPKISAWIEKVPMKPGKIITWCLVVFMCCNMAVSALALVRSTERQQGVPAEHSWQQIMDERYDDEKLAVIYPNAIDVK